MMSPGTRSPVVWYGVALLATAMATALTGLLQSTASPWVYSLFFGAVLISAWSGGRGPAVAATLLSVLAVDYLLVEPRFALEINSLDELLGIGLCLMVAGLMIGMTEALQGARMRAEENAREARRHEAILDRYHLLSEHARDIILFIRTDGQIIEANEAAIAAYGWDREKLLSMTIYDLRDPATVPLVPGQMDRADTTGILFETMHRRKDGSTFPVEVSSRGADIGGERILLSLIRDITERRQAEAAVRESEREFRTMFELAGSGKVQAEAATGRFTRVNRMYCEITGYTEEELLARTFREITHPDDRAIDRDAIEPVLRGERDHWQVEKRYLRKDGQVVWVIVTGSLIRDEEGRPLRAIATIHDITERKRLEQALQEQAEALRTADRRKDEFLAMLAHELRNPLAPIRNAARILQHLGPDEPRFVRAREIIDRQVTHQSRLLDDLLDVSRIIRGKVQIRRESVDLTRLVRDAAEDCRSLMDEAGLGLELALPEVPLWTEGDPTRLAQVAGNLLQNAAKFTPRGGQVTVRLAAEEQRAVLTIRDTGIGIEPELLPHVFEPFTQADQSLDRSRGGLGLGLALVKGLVELHGGEVQAGSGGAGRGAVFEVRLPIAPAASIGEAVPPAALATGPMRILIVEDNRDAAESLRDLLELFGCTVAVAASGPEALAAVQQFRPEVVLCDLGLPGMDGYQVAEALRHDPATRHARLVAVSGYGGEEDQRRSREAGFDLHLTKPVDLDELQRLLEVAPRRQ